jgi:hypothetical protein
MEVDGQRHAPADLPPWGRDPLPMVWESVGPSDVMSYCGNSPPPPRYSIPGTFHLVASRCTEYSISVPHADTYLGKTLYILVLRRTGNK